MNPKSIPEDGILGLEINSLNEAFFRFDKVIGSFCVCARVCACICARVCARVCAPRCFKDSIKISLYKSPDYSSLCTH